MRRGVPLFLATASIVMLVTLVAGRWLGRIGEVFFVVLVVWFPVALILLPPLLKPVVTLPYNIQSSLG